MRFLIFFFFGLIRQICKDEQMLSKWAIELAVVPGQGEGEGEGLNLACCTRREKHPHPPVLCCVHLGAVELLSFFFPEMAGLAIQRFLSGCFLRLLNPRSETKGCLGLGLPSVWVAPPPAVCTSCCDFEVVIFSSEFAFFFRAEGWKSLLPAPGQRLGSPVPFPSPSHRGEGVCQFLVEKFLNIWSRRLERTGMHCHRTPSKASNVFRASDAL